MRYASVCFLLMGLGSCSSPPQPPSVDPTQRRPVNVPAAVELQICQGDLQNSRIRTSETLRLAERASARALRLAQQEAKQANACSVESTTHPVYTILFAFGSAEVVVSSSLASQLIGEARQAELVVARGRTDGDIETAVESRIARERAAAVRAYLVQSGVDPARIRTSAAIPTHASNNPGGSGTVLSDPPPDFRIVNSAWASALVIVPDLLTSATDKRFASVSPLPVL